MSSLFFLLLLCGALACPFAALMKEHQFSAETLARFHAQAHEPAKRQTNVEKTFVISTRLKTQGSPQFGQGFPIGFVVDGVENADLTLLAGRTYRFNVTSSCNHPFYVTSDPIGQGRSPLTGTACNGTVLTFVTNATHVGKPLFYQCETHASMGGGLRVVEESVCDKYSRLLSISNFALVKLVVGGVFDKLTSSESLVLEYFNGVVPVGSVDFTAANNSAKLAALKNSFVAFMGPALGCSDGSIPPYVGKGMKEAHSAMPIGAVEYDAVVDAIVQTLVGAGVSMGEAAAVRDTLNGGTVRGEICNFGGCIRDSLCDKYSGPDLTTIPNSNEVLMAALVDNAVARIVNDSQLVGFFNGQIPSPSTDYVGNAAALAALKRRLVAFFGRRDVLVCPQAQFPATNLTIAQLGPLHANMPIGTLQFNRFNNHVLAAAAQLGVTAEDRAKISAVLNSTEPLICNQRGCSTVPNDLEQVFEISVAPKPNFHSFYQRGFPSALRLDGSFVQGIRLTVGKRYGFRATQPCTHPIYLSPGTGAGSAEITTGVEAAGQLFCGGRLLIFAPQASQVDTVMFMSCRVHPLMSFRVCAINEGTATPCSFATPAISTVCDELVTNVKARNSTLDTAQKVLRQAVTELFGAVGASPALRRYFDGTKPVGSRAIVANATLTSLFVDGLVRWFSTKLLCTDNSIAPYSLAAPEPNMKLVHAPFGITKEDFDAFNDLTVRTLQAVGGVAGAGLSLQTAAKVRVFLDSLSSDMCATCDGYAQPSLCEKWSLAARSTQKALIEGAVVAVATKLFANATTLPLFNGAVPCNSRDFVNDAAAKSQLVASLTAFFGSPAALACNDAAFPRYTGRTDMELVHTAMPINSAMFQLFVDSLVDYLTANLAAAVGPTFGADIAQVRALFASAPIAKICNQAGCPTRGTFVPTCVPTTTTTTTTTGATTTAATTVTVPTSPASPTLSTLSTTATDAAATTTGAPGETTTLAETTAAETTAAESTTTAQASDTTASTADAITTTTAVVAQASTHASIAGAAVLALLGAAM